MSAIVVPKERYPITMTEVTARLASTYVNAYGRMPSKALLGVTAGIIGVENAGGVSIWNGNVGNTTAPTGFEGRVWEANGLQFLDFPGIEAGMTYWWDLMHRRYMPVLIAADRGDVDASIRDLFRLGYVGRVTTAAQEHDYLRGVWAYVRKEEHDIDLIVDQTARPTVAIAVAGASALGVVGLAYLGSRLSA